MRAALLGLLLLAACKPDYSPDTYASTSVQQAAKVDQGTVVGARRVAVTASGAVGGTAGAAAGAAVGASIPGGSVRSTLTAIGGGLVGGAVGVGIERATGDTFAYEYIVRKANGELVSVTQKDEAPMSFGQRVLVIAGPQARIVPDYTVKVDATPTGSAGVTRPDPAPVTIILPKPDDPSPAPVAAQ